MTNSLLYAILTVNDIERVSYLAGFHSRILKQLEHTTPVTEDDASLVLAFRAGDDTAGYKLFVKHHKMVLKVVLDITKGRWFDDDCFNAGTVGLYEAAKRFDIDRGFTFLTYAVPWIRKYVYLEACNSVLPAGGISFSRDFKERMYRFIGFHMMGMADEEICERMNITPTLLEELKVAARTTSQPSSLTMSAADLYGGPEDEEVPVPGLPSAPSAEEVVMESSAIDRFAKIINSIQDDQCRFILRNILFANADDPIDILGESVIIGREAQMKALGITKVSEYNTIKRKAYRVFRKALRDLERIEDSDDEVGSLTDELL